jgi:hypothetical protein
MAWDHSRSPYVTFASWWALIAAALCVPWAARQVARFRPPAPVVVEIVEDGEAA